MDFMDETMATNPIFGREDSYWQRVDGVVSQTIARAIRDARQTANPALQQEAASWLWTCCPDIAEQADLPELQYERVHTLAAAYVTSETGAQA